MENFKQLGINQAMLQSIQRQGFEEPTSIQKKSIPLILEGKDVIAGASTGSGKTLAFGSAIVNDCEHGKGLQVLVLTPTRELAVQVADSLKTFSKYKQLNILAVYGGVSINPQITRLKTADVVVGTPGRVLDHIRRETMNLSRVSILVIDEADRMLDMGFINDVETIIGNCSKKRQTLLFSATITEEVSHLAKRYMNNQVEVSAEPFVDPAKLKQVYYDVPSNLKFSLFVHLLKKEHDGLAMVFCNTRKTVDFVAKNLKGTGIKAIAIHGGFSQAKRDRTINSFHAQNVPVLVCTDVASRGLHIDGVTHIYNYDIPKESKQYIHRIGRTARAGEKGKAISLLSDRDHDNFSAVLRDFPVDIASQDMPRVERVKLIWRGEQRFRGNDRAGNRTRDRTRNRTGNRAGNRTRDRTRNRTGTTRTTRHGFRSQNQGSHGSGRKRRTYGRRNTYRK